jgi:alkylation response protein AidB-like acyl-CoA dehydrogenase
VRFAYDDDQRLFASTLRELLAKECPATRVRQAWDDGTGAAPEVWAALAGTGLTGLLVPEADGGLGRDEDDLVPLLVEVGRAGVPGPVLEHVAVAAPALAGSRWAPALADGSVVATVALDGARVPHARAADLVLTPAGVVETAGAELTDVPALDGGRRLAELGRAAGHPVAFDVPRARRRAALAAAAVLVGLAERLGELAGDHARSRHQFGRPIGSFQAVKHLLADSLLAVDRARPAVERAGWSLATAQPTAGRDVSMAKALASEAALAAARSAIQVHGALGYTWECDVHLFAKKAWALAGAHGDAREHRRRVADALLRPSGGAPERRGAEDGESDRPSDSGLGSPGT